MPPGVEARARVRPGLREFFSSPPLAAVVLLAVNDHVLKARFPGWVTGKLSDVAGCFLLPLFVSALLGTIVRWRVSARLALGAAATCALFGAVKASPPAAGAVARALSAAGAPLGLTPSVIVCDPTDLLALPFIALAFLHGLRAAKDDR